MTYSTGLRGSRGVLEDLAVELGRGAIRGFAAGCVLYTLRQLYLHGKGQA